MKAEAISADTTMAELLEAYPGAQRALFRKFHIGGCSSCGFQPTETVKQVCERNGNLQVLDVLEYVRQAQAEDNKVLIDPTELARLRAEGVPLRLLDIRTREEIDAVRIDGSVPFTQDVMTEILGRWPRQEMLVIYDHAGKKCMDAAAYFQGHGFTQVRALKGGIDRWSQEVDSKLPRYRVELL